MKKFLANYILQVILTYTLSIFFLLSGCMKVEFERDMKVITGTASEITPTSAVISGSIPDLGQGILKYGHCWSIEQNPTLDDSSTNLGSIEKTTEYTSVLQKLLPNTDYYVRAYVSNKKQIEYGEQIKIQTNELGQATIKTGEVRYIDSARVQLVSEIISLGEGIDTIREHGHCWAETENPTVLDSTTKLGFRTSTGEFTSVLKNLTAFKNIYIKAYTITDFGVCYGEQVIVQLHGNLPEVQIISVDSIFSEKIYYTASIPDDGGYTVIERGICWNNAPNPSKENHVFVNGNRDGEYRGDIVGLNRATTYYLRAYAENINGISYSNEIRIKTLPEIPDIETLGLEGISVNSVKANGLIVDNGGEELSSSGFCWSENDLPTIDDYSLIVHNSNSNFYSVIENLSSSTIYYVRAFGVNSSGIGYGESIKFRTKFERDTSFVDPRDNEIYSAVYIGDQCWMAENLRAIKYNNGLPIPNVEEQIDWNNLNSPAYCWYNNDSAAYYSIYGALYNGFTIQSGKLCPAGWHIPSSDEWEALEEYILNDGNEHVSTALKPNYGWAGSIGYDIYGFTALPAGIRASLDPSTFINEGSHTFYWTSNSEPIAATLTYNFLPKWNVNNQMGLSVRCLKDE